MLRSAGLSVGPAAHWLLLPAPLLGVVIVLSSTLIAAPINSAAALSPGEFSVHVEGDRISLEAQDAPMHEVLARLGEELDIPIESLTPEEETITTVFHDLPLAAAMQRLSTGVVYVHDDQGDGIAKIVVLPEGEQAPLSSREANPTAAPESFKFEFDPLQE